MKFNPDHHHRRSIRLNEYDYSQPGAYFVTICTKNRENLFGNLVDGKIILNDAGKMIEKWYFEIMKKFPDIQCDQYIIMPNHIHFIIINVGADLCVCPNEINEHIMDEHAGSPKRLMNGNVNKGEHIGSPRQNMGEHIDSPRQNKGEHAGSPQRLMNGNDNKSEHIGSPLPKIIQWFKTMTTNEYIRNVKNNKWKPFNGKLWQRNYYEHIIRNEQELNKIRDYIINNPMKWESDKY
jgi:REP element-mobilizing transposase RayT